MKQQRNRVSSLRKRGRLVVVLASLAASWYVMPTIHAEVTAEEQQAIVDAVIAELQNQGNVVLGKNSMVTEPGKGGVAIGQGAKIVPGRQGNGKDTLGNAVAVGTDAEAAGYNSVSIGIQSGKDSRGYFNFALGSEAGQGVAGEENISIGRWSNQKMEGSQQIGIGLNAGRYMKNPITYTGKVISSVYSKGGNTALGSGALMESEGASNVALGTRAGYGMRGMGNIVIGTVAGSNVGKKTDGSLSAPLFNSIIMGTQAANHSGGEKNVWLGSFMQNGVVASNTVAIGSNSTVTKQFGLGLGHGITNAAKKGLAVGSYSNLSAEAERSGVFGQSNTVNEAASYAVGNNNTIGQINTFVLGSGVTTTQANSVILGNASADREAVAVTGASIPVLGADGRAQKSIAYKNFSGVGAPANGVISVGAAGKERQIIHVAAGQVTADSTDAVNGSQLYSVAKELQDLVTNVTVGTKGKVTLQGDADSGVQVDFEEDETTQSVRYTVKLGDTITVGKDGVHVDGVKKVIGGLSNTTLDAGWGEDNRAGQAATEGQLKEALAKAGSTTVVKAGDHNIVVTKTEDKAEYAVALSKDITVDSVTVGGNVSIDEDGIRAGDKKITHIADGTIARGSKDAVNGGQLFDVHERLGQIQGDVSTLRQDVNGLRDESRDGLAMGAALSALKPLQYDPYDRNQVMAGLGHYRGKTAVALGLAHFENEGTMWHAGLALGTDSETMVQAGVTWRFGGGKDRDNLPERYRSGPISSVYVLQDEMALIQKENRDLQMKNKALEQENSDIRAVLAEQNRRLAELERRLH